MPTLRSKKSIPSSRSTRNPANRSDPAPSNDPRPAKRRRGEAPAASSSATLDNLGPDATGRSTSSNSGVPPSRHEFDLDLDALTLSNYEKAKPFWPMNRIQLQLAAQSTSNEVVTSATLVLAEALWENFDHSLHMIAMISGCSVSVLKRRMGLLGGSHGENAWHRWLSFSLEAQKNPMPMRGDPDAGIVLSHRNKANSAAYKNLSDDEHSIYTTPIFFALGGYPDYSAVNVTDIDNLVLDDVLVPEVPKLDDAQEARLRPIYEKSVNLIKVAKDRESTTPAATASAIEKRSLQCYKKLSHQLARDALLVGLDYFLIACTKTPIGTGWCRVSTSQEEVVAWLNQKIGFQRLFPAYCQGKSDFEEIRSSLTNSSADTTTVSARPKNDCDKVKIALTAHLNTGLIAALGSLPPQAFPRLPNPIQALKDRNINVIIDRHPDLSNMTEAQWVLGYNAMRAEGRANWLKDCQLGYFSILPLTGGTGSSQQTSEVTDAIGSGTNAGGQASGSGTSTTAGDGAGAGAGDGAEAGGGAGAGDGAGAGAGDGAEAGLAGIQAGMEA